MDRILIIIILSIIMWIDIKKLYIPNFLNLLLLIIAIYLKKFDYEIIENSIIGIGYLYSSTTFSLWLSLRHIK